MATRELEILIKLKDEATKQLSGMSKTVENMQPTFQKMAVVGVAGFTAIAGAVGMSIKAFQEQEKAEARLEQIAKQVTGATNEQIQSYKNLASQLQKTGVVGDEVLVSGQSQIASFTKNANVVTMLTKDLGDLAVAQYGVNVSHEQAIQTGNLLGKALQGQLGALTRTGILVSEDFKKAFEEANTEQERAVVLSKIIQDNYGGLNTALRNTSAGGMVALKNSLGDITEEIGKGFIPILNSIVSKLQPVVDKIVAWVAQNPKLTTTILMIAGALFGLTTIMGTVGLLLPAIIKGFTAFGGAITGVGKAFMFLMANPAILAFIAIAGVIAGLAYLIIQNWGPIKDFFSGLWQGITLIFNGFVTAVQNGLTWIKDLFVNTWEGIKMFLTEVGYFIIGLIASIFDFILPNWEEKLLILYTKTVEIFSIIKDFLVGLWSGIKNFFMQIWTSMIDWISNQMISVKDIFVNVWTELSDFFSMIWTKIVEVFVWAGDKIMGILRPVINMIESVMNGLSAIGKSVGGAVGKVSSGIGNVISAITGRGKTVGVNDAVIAPNGNIVSTHPEDYLIATKNPAGLAGAGGEIIINLNGTFMSPRESMRALTDQMAHELKLRLKL